MMCNIKFGTIAMMGIVFCGGIVVGHLKAPKVNEREITRNVKRSAMTLYRTEKAKSLEESFEHWMLSNDESAAMELFYRLPPYKQAAMADYMAKALSDYGGKKAVTKWIESLDETIFDGVKESCFREAIGLSEENRPEYEDLGRWVLSWKDNGAREMAVRQLTALWVEASLMEAANWVGGLRAGEKGNAFRIVVRSWAERTPYAATEWLVRQERGPDYDLGVVGLLEAMPDMSDDSYQEWSATLSSDGARDSLDRFWTNLRDQEELKESGIVEYAERVAAAARENRRQN